MPFDCWNGCLRPLKGELALPWTTQRDAPVHMTVPKVGFIMVIDDCELRSDTLIHPEVWMWVLCLEVHFMKNGKRRVGLSIWECTKVRGLEPWQEVQDWKGRGYGRSTGNEARDVEKVRAGRTAGVEPLFTLQSNGKALKFLSREICPYFHVRKLTSSVVEERMYRMKNKTLSWGNAGSMSTSSRSTEWNVKEFPFYQNWKAQGARCPSTSQSVCHFQYHRSKWQHLVWKFPSDHSLRD